MERQCHFLSFWPLHSVGYREPIIITVTTRNEKKVAVIGSLLKSSDEASGLVTRMLLRTEKLTLSCLTERTAEPSLRHPAEM